MTAIVPVRAGEPAGPASLAARIYATLKDDIFEFRLLPGQRFSEHELAERLATSRTTVRSALQRLMQEGYVEVQPRSGWAVVPFDFERFEHLYDLRLILEMAAVRRLCEQLTAGTLAELEAVWLVPPRRRQTAMQAVSRLDEDFHGGIVALAGNPEMSRVHRGITERIRIVRRLDFTQSERVRNTYDEHGAILRAIARRRADQAAMLLKAHIETSKAEVRKITLHRLYEARGTPAMTAS